MIVKNLIRPATLLAYTMVFSWMFGASFAVLAGSQDKGQLAETSVEVVYSRIDVDRSGYNDNKGLGFRLRNRTVDNWYIEIQATDTDFVFYNEKDTNTAVDNIIDIRLGKQAELSARADFYAGLNYLLVEVNDGREGDLGLHTGIYYRPIQQFTLQGDVAFIELDEDEVVQLSVAAYAHITKHIDWVLRAKRWSDINTVAYEAGVNVHF